jgi:hypothetical protein
MPYLTTCNNTVNKIQCVVRNTIKYNTVNIFIKIEPTPIGGRG